VPANEGDRLVWYLELLETQMEVSQKMLQRLNEYTAKVSIEVSGSVAGAAQVKAASFELASRMKMTADEVECVKYVCGLIRRDLVQAREGMGKEPLQDEQLRLHSKREKESDGPGTTSAQSPFRIEDLKAISITKNYGAEVEDLRERLHLAENVKKSIETEFAECRIQQNYEIEELKERLHNLIEINGEYKKQNEDLIMKMTDMERSFHGERDVFTKLTMEKNELQSKSHQFEKENEFLSKNQNERVNDINKMKQQLNKSKIQNEKKLSEKENTITKLDAENFRLKSEIERLHVTLKKLQNEKALILRQSEAFQNQAVQALQQENRELDIKLKSEIEDRVIIYQTHSNYI
jgi:DNA repair exonuclease SbcCD ATPase subunit